MNCMVESAAEGQRIEGLSSLVINRVILFDARQFSEQWDSKEESVGGSNIDKTS